MGFRKIIAGVLCAALGITLCGCGGEKIPELTENAAPPAAAVYKTVSPDKNGVQEITRKELGNTPMGEDGTWTIFVYMSGSSLEADTSMGSRDMEEMCKAAVGERVRFIVQTGGSKSWRYDAISPDRLERHVIANGERKTVASLPLASMGEAATLRNFLTWGIENYPAAKIGLVLWGHGKGSVEGVCKDDLFDDDYLRLDELNNALSEASAHMTDKLEFVGFDACYMGTLEAADILATYARYMIGSEEVEPNNGWNYTAFGNVLAEEPAADWNKIAQTVCGSFRDESKDGDNANRITLSVIDLSKIDGLLNSLNAYASELCDALTSKEQLREFNTALENSEHFGSETKYDGYSNKLDLGAFANAGRELSDKAAALSEALDGAVVSKNAGSLHRNASGLTIYYPFEARGTSELRTLGGFAECPYYMAFVEKMLLSASPSAELEAHDKETLAALCTGGIGGENRPLDEYFRDLGSRDDLSGISSFLKTDGELTIGDDGKYELAIAPKTLRFVSHVGIRVSRKRSDGDYSEFGTLLCSNADWESGRFSGIVDGRWITLPNREPFALKPREITSGGVSYLTEIRFSSWEMAASLFADTRGRVYIEGVWTLGEIGLFTLEQPENGSVYAPRHKAHPRGGAATVTYLGRKYEFEAEPSAVFDMMDDGEYYCVVTVTDVWGDTLESEIKDFTITGGVVSFK